MRRQLVSISLLVLSTLHSASVIAENCVDPIRPQVLPADLFDAFVIDQVFCDEFTDDRLNEQYWSKDIMHSDDHQTGLDQLDIEYEETDGRRWSAFYDNHLDKTAFVARDEDNRGVLIQRGIYDTTTNDPDKDQAYTDPEDPFNDVNFGRGKLYTSFLKTFDSDSDNIFVPVNSDFDGYWGPGHFFEIRVNFGNMRMGGHRHSFWLMPATTEEYGGLSDVCADDDPVAYDCNVENGVEIDIYEYEASPSTVRNKLYMKVLGGDVGKTVNTLDFHPPGINYSDLYKSEVVVSSRFEQGPLNTDQWHTVGLYWGNERLVWYIDSVPVVQDTEHVPTTPHYLLLTREMNSGVLEGSSDSSVTTNRASIPIDAGLAGENVGLRKNLALLGRIDEAYEDLSLENKDYVKTDYVRVWRISGELPSPAPPANSTDVASGTVIINGNIIRLSNGNRFEVRSVDSSNSTCEASDGPCQVSLGTYIVSDVESGRRYDNIIIDNELPIEKSISEKGGVFFLPRGQYYEIQSSTDYQTICAGKTRCRVDPGSYNIINQDRSSPNRRDNWEVSGSIISTIYIDENNVINWPGENGWFEVQKYPNLETICEGQDRCAVEPGQYVVINHWTNERFEVNATGVQDDIQNQYDGRPMNLNDARDFMGIANAEDFFELIRLLATAQTRPDRRPSIPDNLGTPTIDVDGIASTVFKGEEINYIASRICPSGGIVYYNKDIAAQSSQFDFYYDDCRFTSHRIDGSYSIKKVASLDVTSRHINIVANIGSKNLQVTGKLNRTSPDSTYSKNELILTLFDVSTPGSSYTSTNTRIVSEWERGADVPFHLAKESISSQVRLSNFDSESVNYLINTTETLQLNDAKNSITSGMVTIDSGSTMNIVPIPGTVNEYKVTLQEIATGMERSRDVLMEGLRPARSAILAR